MVNVANGLQAETEAYLQAFDRRDLARCLEFYEDEAVLHFQTAVYRGRKAIETWHTERFAADLRLTKLDRLAVNGDHVLLDATATSNRLRAWKIASVSGRVTLTFREGKIREAKFTARMGPLEMLG